MASSRSGASMHSFRSNGASLGDPESDSGLMSGIVAARRSLSSNSSSSEEESSTGMSSRESTYEDMGILEEESDEDDFDDAPKMISGRGAMIGGVSIPQHDEKEMDPPAEAVHSHSINAVHSHSINAVHGHSIHAKDLETGAVEAPDSDYAPDFRALSTVFPSDEFQTRSMRESSTDSALPAWLTKPMQSAASNKAPSATSRSSEESGHDNNTKKNFERFTDDVVSENSGRLRRHPRLWYILGGVSMLLLAAVITVAVLVFKPSGGLTSQQQQLSEFAKSISSEEDLQNKASPQALAYEWLVNEDTFYKDSENIPRDWAVQRYVLAIFYYATKGPYNWEVTTGWLKDSECRDEWLGVACNDQGYVRTLAFGKFTVPFIQQK